jgi:hypothetical protein
MQDLTQETPGGDLIGEMGGPGPEDWANALAALASALTREAQSLAGTAAALRTVFAPVPGDPTGGAISDVRRQRQALAAAGEAAMRAALALEAAEALGAAPDPAVQANRIAAAAKRAGLAPVVAAPLLRAAALDFRTDDAAARIAATSIVQQIAGRLERA